MHDENKLKEPNQCLSEKQDRVMPLSTYFHGQLILWGSLCMQKLWFTMDNFCFEEAILIQQFPQTPKNFLKYSASCLQEAWEQWGLNLSKIDSRLAPQQYLQSSFRRLTAYAMYNSTIFTLKISMHNAHMSIYFHRTMATSPLLTLQAYKIFVYCVSYWVQNLNPTTADLKSREFIFFVW